LHWIGGYLELGTSGGGLTANEAPPTSRRCCLLIFLWAALAD